MAIFSVAFAEEYSPQHFLITYILLFMFMQEEVTVLTVDNKVFKGEAFNAPPFYLSSTTVTPSSPSPYTPGRNDLTDG